jgi:hypothetical protein
MSETLVKQLDIVKRTLKEAGKDVCVSAVNEAVGEIKRLQAELDKVKRERDSFLLSLTDIAYCANSKRISIAEINTQVNVLADYALSSIGGDGSLMEANNKQQQIKALEDFIPATLAAIRATAVPEIDWEANTKMRNAVANALEMAYLKRIQQLKEEGE